MSDSFRVGFMPDRSEMLTRTEERDRDASKCNSCTDMDNGYCKKHEKWCNLLNKDVCRQSSPGHSVYRISSYKPVLPTGYAVFCGGTGRPR